MARKTALITGVTGQDGAYLAELLATKGYEVHGLARRCSSPNTGRINQLVEAGALFLHFGDMVDANSLTRLVAALAPDEIYNLAAQSHVHVSFETPEYTGNAGALGALRLLDAIRAAGLGHRTRFYQASTSEMFGASPPPQSEVTPLQPRSPYGAAKVYAYWMTRTYREAYGMFAANGILFNHESPLRGDTFVSRKITRGVAEIAHGRDGPIMLGNLNAVRDWGHARDYADAMWRMLQHDTPEDFVIATGVGRTVREFAEAAFACIGVELVWAGHEGAEVGRNRATGRALVRIDPALYRPTEVEALIGDASKAMRMLGWAPSTTFADLVAEMVEADMEQAGGRVHSRPPLVAVG